MLGFPSIPKMSASVFNTSHRSTNGSSQVSVHMENRKQTNETKDIAVRNHSVTMRETNMRLRTGLHSRLRIHTDMCVYVRAPVGLEARGAPEALSRGSDEGSRKLLLLLLPPRVGLPSAWPCPSSSRLD